MHDEVVEAYNKQIRQGADANPKSPALTLLKTRLQVHKEGTIFGALAGGVMIAVGLMVCYFTRSKPEATTTVVCRNQSKG